MFDCKRVIYANRMCKLTEGEKLVVLVDLEEIVTGPICKSLHFFPPEEGPLHVLAQFEGGAMKYIYDVDEVEGKEVL